LLRPFISASVQLCFRVPDRKGLWQPESQVGFELMWVTVTSSKGKWPNTTYQGELHNIPVFMPPARVRIGSAVTFRMSHVAKNLSQEMMRSLDRPRLAIEEDSEPLLTVRYPTRKPAYLLTAEAIQQAGRDLYDSGLHDWSYSSDVDFPKDFGC